MKGSFWIDALSTIPLDSLAELFLDQEVAKNFKLFGCLKLIRVLRLNRIIRDMNAQSHIKATLKIVKLGFFLLLYIHVISCLWYAIVKQDLVWSPPMTVLTSLQTNPNESIFSQTMYFQYWVCTYSSCLFLYGNDVYPKNWYQVAFAAAANAIGSFCLVFIFGELAILVSELNVRDSIL